MLIFLAIMFAGFILTVGGFLLGHDHDGGHGDHGSDHGHDAGHDSEPTISIFSPKVIGTFIMGFGGGGCIGEYIWNEVIRSSFLGIGVGVLMALCMFGVLRLMYGQQSTSLVDTATMVGRTGIVTLEIDPNAIGQVVVQFGHQTWTYLARAPGGKTFPKGKNVKVVSVGGTEIVVDEVES